MLGHIRMFRPFACLLLAGMTAGCAHLQTLSYSPNSCYTESGRGRLCNDEVSVI